MGLCEREHDGVRERKVYEPETGQYHYIAAQPAVNGVGTALVQGSRPEYDDGKGGFYHGAGKGGVVSNPTNARLNEHQVNAIQRQQLLQEARQSELDNEEPYWKQAQQQETRRRQQYDALPDFLLVC